MSKVNQSVEDAKKQILVAQKLGQEQEINRTLGMQAIQQQELIRLSACTDFQSMCRIANFQIGTS